MQTLTFNAVIDERRLLSLALPNDIRLGRAKVTVTLEEDSAKQEAMAPAGASRVPDEVHEQMLRFGDGRLLGDMSLRDLISEGRNS